MGVKSVSTFWLLMNKYDSIWNKKAPKLIEAFIEK